MLSGHTHGGQVRFPFVRAAVHPLAADGQEASLRDGCQLGRLQLYVNRGIGSIRLPFRLNCPPEITVITLRAREELPAVSTS